MRSLTSLRRMGASVLALGRIRLELMALELQDERDRLVMLLFWAVLAAWSIGLALLLVVAFMTVWWWDTHRLMGLGLGTALLALVGAMATLQMRSRMQQPRALFATSLAELRRDEQALAGRQAVTPARGAAVPATAGAPDAAVDPSPGKTVPPA